MSTHACQRFGVEEIRQIRNEDAERYQSLSMTPEEISKDISERAKEARELIERIKVEKFAQQGA